MAPTISEPPSTASLLDMLFLKALSSVIPYYENFVVFDAQQSPHHARHIAVIRPFVARLKHPVSLLQRLSDRARADRVPRRGVNSGVNTVNRFVPWLVPFVPVPNRLPSFPC
jgi:hypothetical protein